MDRLAWFGPLRFPGVVAFFWMLGPTVFLGHSLWGLLRRHRLRTRGVPVESVITTVNVFSALDSADEGMVVDLELSYEVNGASYAHRESRSDHHKKQYEAGGTIELLYERGNPANVMDAQRRPWDDVIGPVVLSVLLFVFMGWLWLFLSGLSWWFWLPG
jgi:Protein of unknown function (DUF3592)